MQTVQRAPKHIAAPPVSADGYINVAKVSKSYGGEGFTKTGRSQLLLYVSSGASSR